MKKLFFIPMLFAIITHSNAQGIWSDVNFLKATNHLWCACSTLKNIESDNRKNLHWLDNVMIEAVEKNVAMAKQCYASIKSKYPNDQKPYENLKLNINLIEKCSIAVREHKIKSDKLLGTVVIVESSLECYLYQKLK
jgi:intracellular sulfur oxidation DsrE/DsrF family protein